MKKPNNSFEYKFVGDLLYIDSAEDGKERKKVKAKKITIKAPTRKNLGNCLFLEQTYKKAESKMATNFVSAVGQEYINNLRDENKATKQEKEDIEINTQTIIDTLMSGDADIEKCFVILGYILSSGTKDNPNALIDDKVQMNETIYGDIDSIDDLKGLLGAYIQNFFISSQNV